MDSKNISKQVSKQASKQASISSIRDIFCFKDNVDEYYKSFIIDIIRIISSIAVFFIHYIAVLASRFYVSDSVLSKIKYWSGISVPLFFITSGYCIFSKKRTYKDIYKKIVEFIFFLIITNTLCVVFNKIFSQRSVDIFDALYASITESLYFNTVSHLWFMPSIICIYLFIPLFTGLNDNDLYIFTILIIFFTIFKSRIPFFDKLNFSICLPYYFSYFLCGGLIRKKIFDKKIFFLTLFVNLLSIVLKFDNTGYDSLSFFFISILIFYILLNYQFIRLKYNIRNFGTATIYVYLFHPFIIHLLFDVLKINTFKNNNYLLFFLIGLLSYCIVFAFSVLLQNLFASIKETLN